LTSWLVWLVLGAVAVILGAVGRSERFKAFLEDQRKRDYPADLRCQCHDVPAGGQIPQALAGTDSPIDE